MKKSPRLLVVSLVLAALAQAQTYTDLFSFDGTHGQYPTTGILAQGRDGSLYGTTVDGGTSNLGVVFRITPGGTLKVLYNFDGSHGSQPLSGLTLGRDGDFYGTTLDGGEMGCSPYAGCGTVFKITANGNLTTLHLFGYPGAYPIAAPIQGTDGNFYGTTSGLFYIATAYKITPSGTFTKLSSNYSYAPLLQGTDGNFYGTRDHGGDHHGDGTVFRMTPKGVRKSVYEFDGTHGANPYGPVIQAGDGSFYGTTTDGGSENEGVVFKLTADGAITVLHNFGDPKYPDDGQQPYAGLVQATDGNFYGVAEAGGTMGYGLIFQITPAGSYSVLYNFDGTHGEYPLSTPVQHTNGKIYGLTEYGGASNDGVVYSLDMGLGPFVSLLPTSGQVGKTVEVLGQGFTGATGVSFNETPATYTVVTDTYLTAKVPSGATTGYVTVTTPSGTLTSNKEFQVK
jgi:uncharacterized repeat protein (TIGR03803 family)